MNAATEVERRSPSVAAVQMHFADLDAKQSPNQHSPPCVPVRIGLNPVPPPPADELAERLAKLEKWPQTPRARDLRPVPAPLAKSTTSKASDSTQRSHQDSGYASIASSPEGLETKKSQQSTFSSSKLRVFDRPVPEYLQHRFYDMKVLCSEDLLKAVYKKNIDQKDLSMKLKYLGKSEPSAQLYIVVQCEAKFAKKVKKFFAQSIVKQYLGDDFKLHVLNRAPQGLASDVEIKVYGLDTGATNTLCGQPIMLSNGEASAFATMGGIVQVVMDIDSDPQFYGFTAAHSLIPLIRANTAESADSTEDSVSESSDNDNDDDVFDQDEDILFDAPSEEDVDSDTQTFSIHEAGFVGKIMANSVEMPVNRDWSLVSLDRRSWLPNFLEPQISSKGVNGGPIYFSNASLPFSYSATVTVLTCRGPQHGRLETNKSFLFSAPGAELIQTFDLKLEPDYRLRPRDSGSWVVDPSSCRILGHVASIDEFGEAFIVPFQDTLSDIRNSLGAVHVRLPSQDDIYKLRSKSKYPAPPTGQSLMEGVGPRSIRSTVRGSTGSASSSLHGSGLQDEDLLASTQVDKVDEHPAPAPTTTTVTRINSDPTAAPKKQFGDSGIGSNFWWERMVNTARDRLHNKSGHDSGYSSLQPSAQVSPVPSPPQPRKPL